jgi:hypothetical protein
MKFAVELFDFAAEPPELAFQQAHAIDLDGGFHLQVFEIDSIPMKASRLHCSRFEAFHQLVSKGAAMGMVTAGVLGNEAEQGRTPCFDDARGIEQVVQDGQRQISTKIWQNSLDGGTGPAHQIDQPTGNQDIPVGSITAVMVLSAGSPSRNRATKLLRLSDVKRKRIGFACGRPSSKMRAT